MPISSCEMYNLSCDTYTSSCYMYNSSCEMSNSSCQMYHSSCDMCYSSAVLPTCLLGCLQMMRSPLHYAYLLNDGSDEIVALLHKSCPEMAELADVVRVQLYM